MSLKITLQHDETGRHLDWSLDEPIPPGYSIVSNEQGPVFGEWKLPLEWSEFATSHTEKLNEIANLASIGASWRKDSSLEKWFPFTARELEAVKASYGQLYELVEAYLCTPNTNPATKDHYDSLVAWFQSNKRPDGREPFPVSPEQERFL